MQLDSFVEAVPVSIECDRQRPIELKFTGELGWPARYWRTGKSNKSLVEIGLARNSGAICNINVVLLRELSDQRLLPMHNVEDLARGLPCASLSSWPDNQRYINEEHEVSASVVDNRLTISFGDFGQPLPNSVRCDRVVFLIDQSNTLRGFEVLQLSESEIDNIQYAVYERPLSPELRRSGMAPGGPDAPASG